MDNELKKMIIKTICTIFIYGIGSGLAIQFLKKL